MMEKGQVREKTFGFGEISFFAMVLKCADHSILLVAGKQ